MQSMRFPRNCATYPPICPLRTWHRSTEDLDEREGPCAPRHTETLANTFIRSCPPGLEVTAQKSNWPCMRWEQRSPCSGSHCDIVCHGHSFSRKTVRTIRGFLEGWRIWGNPYAGWMFWDDPSSPADVRDGPPEKENALHATA